MTKSQLLDPFAASTLRPDVLYHGTSSAIWAVVQSEGFLRPAPFGHQHISLTTDVHVARYFAQLAVDAAEGPDCNEPVILLADRADLEAVGIRPTPFVDPIWGIGECEWEREEAVSRPIPCDLLRPIGMNGLKHSKTRDEIIRLQDAGSALPGAEPAL